LTRPALAVGVLAVILVGVIGNLDSLVQTFDALGKAGRAPFTSRIPGLAGALNALVGIGGVIGGRPLPGFDFWRSTRVIGPEEPGPITEFPFFSFLYGDLHAHVLALPITVAVVLVALSAVWLAEARGLLPTWSDGASRRDRVRAVVGSRWLGLVALFGLLVGTLRATNTWDFPTYVTLAAVAMGIGHYRQVGRIDARVVGWTLAAAGGVVAVATLLYLPYQRHYELFYVGVDPVKNTTSLVHFLTVLGLPIFVLGALLALESLLAVRSAGRALADPVGAGRRLSVATLVRDPRAAVAACVVVLLAGSAIALLVGRQSLAFLIALGAVLVVHLVRQRRSGGALLMLALAGLALAVVAVPEVVALKGDVGRMNTVFKFHLQAWVLLSLVAAPAIVLVTRRLGGLVQQGRLSPRWRTFWAVGLGVLLVGAALYPLRATPTKLGLRFEPLPPTLDGMAFMTEARYEDRDRDLGLPDDYRAIQWMLENVQGSPVILEGQSGLYRWHARFSTYTGLPTIIGWDWHQKQQRGDFAPWIDERVRDVKTLYETGDVAAARRLLRKYEVAYVVVGGLERAYYPAPGLAKFDSMVRAGWLDIAYRAGGVTIYRVVPTTGVPGPA
jgi:YYY domain-containing protein